MMPFQAISDLELPKLPLRLVQLTATAINCKPIRS
jgi:hypothetical protein